MPYNVEKTPAKESAYFTKEEYLQRFQSVRDRMRRHNFAALLITSPENIYYLLGLSHQGYFAFTMLIFPLEGMPFLVTRAMEQATIAKRAPNAKHVGFAEQEKPAQAVYRALKEAGLADGRIGVEQNNMFFPPRISRHLRELLQKADWQDASGLVDEIRFIKSPAEILSIREAARITSYAARRAIEEAHVGVNEKDVAAQVYRDLISEGSEYPGFAPLIRSTETLREEHVTWRDYVFEPGDGLFLEFSAAFNRYHAPLSRMLYLKEAPRGIQASADVALEGLHAVRDYLKPGVLTGDVYEVWQKTINKGLGHTKYVRHHCGYTVGIGFPPSWVGGSTVIGICRRGDIAIQEGMVFHVLSWLLNTTVPDYVISDTILITKDGAEVLTDAPYDVVVKE